eukprot:4510614-Pyramimonas_sp.AAC.1
MKDADEKWCTTCRGWATRAEADEAPRHGDDRSGDAAPDGGGTKRIRTMYCAKCSHVKAKQKSRSGNAKWNESVGTVRCSNDACLSLHDGKGEMSEAQKKHNAAGERLCRKCAAEREKEVRRGNAEAANRKRKAEADAKSLICAACGGAFSDTKHLKPGQVEDHRKAKGAKVVCGGCKDL